MFKKIPQVESMNAASAEVEVRVEHLLVSTDARMLAACARLHGKRCVVVDCVEHGDAESNAHLWIKTPAQVTTAPDFDGAALVSRLQTLPDEWASLPLIYGAGFDHRRELLARISRHHRLIGNDPDTLSLVSEPVAMMELARHLGLPFVDTCVTAPEAPESWLARHLEDEYDRHSATATADMTEAPTRYFQRDLPGRRMAAIFVGNGARAQILGICEYLSGERHAIVGAVSQAQIPPGARMGVTLASEKLTRACGLVGLNRLDFTLAGDRWTLNRLTARPTDEMMLFDAEIPDGALAAHIAAVAGGLMTQPNRGRAVIRGMRVVRTPRSMLIDRTPFPAWCLGVPPAGRVIPRGETLCTVWAEGLSHDEVRASLITRSQLALRPRSNLSM